MVSAPAEGTPTLELRDVSKAFGQVIALRSGSLTLYSGSIHALVGENGAGKSTWRRGRSRSLGWAPRTRCESTSRTAP